jgi:uncharacterized phage-associated protein
MYNQNKVYNKTGMLIKVTPEPSSRDIVKYLVYKSYFYGDPITNLRLQKLLYYVYVWLLVLKNKRVFHEKFQAWPIGPVLPSTYRDLKKYEAGPIDPDYCGIKDKASLEALEKRIGSSVMMVIDNVFQVYGPKSAFELVNLTHSELPWVNARKGLDIEQKSSNEIEDKDIKSFYGPKIKKQK